MNAKTNDTAHEQMQPPVNKNECAQTKMTTHECEQTWRSLPSPTYSIWTPLDSTGLHWIPVALLPGQIGSCNVQSSPVPVQWTKSTVRVQWSPVSYLLILIMNTTKKAQLKD